MSTLINPITGNCPECFITPLSPCDGDVVVPDEQVEIHYLAARVDDVDGSGDAHDPRDASTPTKLDAIFASRTGPTKYILFPGLFETATGVTLYDNQSIHGSGEELTTLKLADGSLTTASQRINMIGTYPVQGYESQVVTDLTIDANLDNQPAVTADLNTVSIFPCILNAAITRIENVRVIGAYIDDSELFAIAATSGSTPAADQPPHTATIRNVKASDLRKGTGGGAITCICVLNFLYAFEPYANARFHGLIENCTVDNAGGGVGIAYQMCGVSSGTVRDCLSTGCPYGFFADTSTCHNISIVDNKFLDLTNGGTGVFFNTPNAGQTKGIIIRDNIFRAKAGQYASYVQFNSPDANDTIIEGNSGDNHGDMPDGFPSGYYYGIHTMGACSGVIRNNIFNGNFIRSEINSNGFHYSGNRYVNGRPVVDGNTLSTLREPMRVRQLVVNATQAKIPLGQCFDDQQCEFDISVKTDIAGWDDEGIVMRVSVDGQGVVTASKVRGTASPVFQFYFNSLGSGVFAFFIGNNTNAPAGGSVEVSLVGTPIFATANDGSGATAVSYS